MMRKKESMNAKLFAPTIVTKKVNLHFNKCLNNTKGKLQSYLNKTYTGKCQEEGFIRENSIEITSYSAGLCKSEFVEYMVVFTCDVCNIFEDMVLSCVVENTTKAGLKCKVVNIGDDSEGESRSPVVVFCARDHHYNHSNFHNIGVDQTILVNVIGSRYELHDEYISVIGIVIE